MVLVGFSLLYVGRYRSARSSSLDRKCVRLDYRFLERRKSRRGTLHSRACWFQQMWAETPADVAEVVCCSYAYEQGLIGASTRFVQFIVR